MILTLYIPVGPLLEFVLYQASDIPGLFWHSEPQDLLFWNTIYHMVDMVGEAVAMEIIMEIWKTFWNLVFQSLLSTFTEWKI